VWNPRSCTHSNHLCFPLFLSVLMDPYVYGSTSSQTAMESLSQLLARVLVTPTLAVASRGLQRQGRPLGDDAGFHAVVGNPPYVRQEALGSLKPYLADAYPEVFHGVADLYVYFYEQGLRQLRRLMCNELDEQVRQMSKRSAEGVVDPLSTGVGRDLGRQASQQPSQRLRPVALQAEEVLESWQITPSMICRLPAAHLRSSFDHALRESFFGVAATSAP
jgi:hypothetical protein